MTTNRVLRCVFAIAVLLWVSGSNGRHPTVVAQARPGSTTKRSVRITAQQVRATPAAYVFVVTNLGDVPVSRIVIGKALNNRESPEGILCADVNIPQRLVLPPGWVGTVTACGGTSFMSYFWRTDDQTKAIKPGESRCDFRVELAPFVSPKPEQYVGPHVFRQPNFHKTPFLILWPSGPETEGTISTHALERQ